MVHPLDEYYLISLKHGESDTVQYLVVKEQKPKLWLHMTASITFKCPWGRTAGTGKHQLRHELVSLSLHFLHCCSDFIVAADLTRARLTAKANWGRARLTCYNKSSAKGRELYLHHILTCNDYSEDWGNNGNVQNNKGMERQFSY